MTQPLPVEAERLDRYEILAELASGGMATVYLGRLPGAGGFERLVAIKRLHPHLERDTSFVSMFLDEARIAARIRHPNVVSTLEIGTAERGYFLVMDYVEGPTLSRLLSKAAQVGDRIPTKVALRILHDTLSGLHAAHELTDEQGKPLHIVHRDVSPQNVLIGTDGTSRITDFGVARAMNRLSHTSTGQLKGKLGYMAPEQARGEEVDRRADLFAAGIMLWEVLAGRRLFKGRSETDAETLHRVLQMEIPPVATQNPDVTAALDAVLLRALDRDLSRRFATAADFVDALEAAAGPLIGSTRDVAKYLEATVGQELAERRAAVRTMSALVMGEHSVPNVPRLVPSSVSSATLSVPQLTRSGPVSVVMQQPPPKSNAVVIGVLAGALIVALGGVGLLLMLRRDTPPPVAAATPPTTSSAPSATAPAPSADAPSSAAAPAISSTAPTTPSAPKAGGGPWKGPAGGPPPGPKPGGDDGLSVNPYRP